MELPDFTVLTGLNGAGKSHLLEAIDEGSVIVVDPSGVNPASEITLLSYKTFELQQLKAHNVDAGWTQRTALLTAWKHQRSVAISARDAAYRKYGLDPSQLEESSPTTTAPSKTGPARGLATTAPTTSVALTTATNRTSMTKPKAKPTTSETRICLPPR